MGKPITLLNSRQYLKKNIMAISNIEKNGSWYYIYDEKGKKAKTLSVSAIGDIVDFSADFFVTKSPAKAPKSPPTTPPIAVPIPGTKEPKAAPAEAPAAQPAVPPATEALVLTRC